MLTTAIEKLFFLITLAPLLSIILTMVSAEIKGMVLVFYILSAYKLVTMAHIEFKMLINNIKDDNLKQSIYKILLDNGFNIVNKYINKT